MRDCQSPVCLAQTAATAAANAQEAETPAALPKAGDTDFPAPSPRRIQFSVDLDETIDAHNGRTFWRIIPLKAADDVVDRDKLAFAIGHPSTLRRLIVLMNEQHGVKAWKEMGGGLLWVAA